MAIRECTVTVMSDGTVQGVYADMDSNSESALTSIQAKMKELTKKTLDSDFWDSFFWDGRNGDFSNSLAYLAAEVIHPPRTIEAKNVQNILMGSANLVNGATVEISDTNTNPSLYGICMGCSKMITPPTISFTSTSCCRNYNSAFANCTALKTVTIWLGDGTQDAVKSRIDMGNTFLNCISLTDITFTGSGSPKNLDLSGCTALNTVTTCASLLKALQVIPAGSSGTYIIYISQAQFDALKAGSETGPAELFLMKNWTLAVK
jgi:hypothetical protein